MMDEDYFLFPLKQILTKQIECKKHGEKTPFTLEHKYFCPNCVADYLEKAIGQVKVKVTYE